MQSRSFNRLVVVLTLVITFLLAIFAADVQARRETHQFTLYKARNAHDPYVLSFPITVTRPGEIRVYGKIYSADRGTKHPVRASIVHITSSKKHPRRAVARVAYDSKRQSFQMRYAADSMDLKAGGKFEILVGNMSTKRNATGEMLIVYPVAGETEQGATPIYPDLAIAGIGLDANCRVQMTITNKGPGRLAPVFWTRDIPTVRLYRNGRSWGGANLKVVDPQQNLRRVGGQAVYRSNLKVSGSETIKVVINPGPRLREANTQNNTREVRLRCRGASRPDLAVKEIRVVGGCKVAVTIVNAGPGDLPDAAWQQGSSPTVYLYRNGRSWGGANLIGIDRTKRLRRPGGEVQYVSNLRVSGTERIKAMVDFNNTLREGNETNNIMVRQLSCAQ
ncbi:MAG: hypothetical protein JRJ29_04860 [Deltaproteobacteria bacterium]|nr:hypothetical protein [Deltaproteobacteria bacterium]